MHVTSYLPNRTAAALSPRLNIKSKDFISNPANTFQPYVISLLATSGTADSSWNKRSP